MRRPGTLIAAAGATLIAIAIAAAVGLGGLAARTDAPPTASTPDASSSTALPVSRRADPSIDRYTWSERPTTPLARMTDAQRWLSRSASPFVAHDSDPRVSRNLLGWATEPDVHVYVNATGVGLHDPRGLREAARWIVRRGGRPVLVDDWAMLDVRQPAARRWWLYGTDGKASCTADRDRRGALDLIACGYTGLWVDNVLTAPAQRFRPDPGIDAGAWGDGLVALLTELRAALPAGIPFTINAHWTDLDFPYAGSPSLDPGSALARSARIADQLVIEGGAIDSGLDYPGDAAAAWSYPRLLAYADALHGVGARVQWEKVGSQGLTSSAAATLGALPSCLDRDYARPQPAWRRGSAAWRGHVRTSGFNLATALLTFAPGDGVGDLCEYPGRGFAGYGVDLGAPLSPRAATGDGVIARAFAGGYVAVNPTDATVRVTLPEGRTGVDVASRSRVATTRAATFALPPRTALIAVYGDPEAQQTLR